MKKLINILGVLFLVFCAHAPVNAQCDFVVQGNAQSNDMVIFPPPSTDVLDDITDFLGNVDLVTPGQNGVSIELMANASEEQLLGVIDILCGDLACPYELDIGTEAVTILIRPIISTAQIAAIQAIKSDLAEASQYSAGSTGIAFDSPITASELQQMREALCPPTEPIPTMGEWGLIALGFLLMIVGVVAVRSRRLTLQP